MGAQKEIVAKLKLDSKEFKGKLDETHKSILKVTAGFTAVSAAVVAAAKATANYRDETIKASRAAGATAEDFSALRHAANLSGLSLEQLTKGLQKLSNPAGQAQEQLSRLGISLVDSSGKAKTQTQLLLETADAFKGLSTPAQKSSAALKIFGEEGAKMVNLLSGGSAGIRAMTDEADRMGLTFSTQAGEAAELFNDNITRLTGSLKGMIMSLTDSVIELVNTSGIMETLSGAVQAVTGWWKGLDESTRSVITTMGAVVAVVAALVLALAGVVAIAPMVTAAVTAMTGGINLIVLAVAAAIAGFAAVAMGAMKYWDQVKQAVQPAIDTMRDAVDSIRDALQPIYTALAPVIDKVGKLFDDIVDGMREWMGLTDESMEGMSWLGTIAKAVMAAIASSVIITVGTIKTLADSIAFVVQSFRDIAIALEENTWQAFDQVVGKMKAGAQDVWQNFSTMGDRVKEAFSDIVVTIDTKEAKKAIEGIKNEMAKASGQAIDLIGNASNKISKLASDVGGYFGEYVSGFASLGKGVFTIADQIGRNLKTLADQAAQMADKVGAVFSMIGNIASSMGSIIIDSIVAPIQAATARLNRYLELYTGLYSNHMEEVIERTAAAEDEKLAMLEAKYDAQIKALEDAERRKNSAIEFAKNERLLMMDEEYQMARDKAEEDFELWMEQEEIRYEAEKAIMLQKSIDKEQAMLVEALMDNDFKLYLENREAVHKSIMQQLATDYATRARATDDAFKAQQAASEALANQQLQAVTEEKNAALTKAEEEKNTKLQKLAEKKASDEKKLKKAQILMNWKAEQSEFRSTQGMKIAQTIVTGVAGAAQAFALAAGTIPIVGVIIGAVLAAAVLAMTFASVAQMATQQPPSAPPALFLASGGVMQGPPHSQGGISANLEGGEGVIDKARTEKLLDAVDGATGSRRGLNVYFEPGSIVNNGKDVDDGMISQIADALARKLERQGVYA